MSLKQNIRFSKQLRAFKEKAVFRTRETFVRTVAHCHRSITIGSEVSGAPGQPVDIGTLRSSWQIIWEGTRAATIATRLDYALAIEHGTSHGRKMKLRSQVGGFHSVKITMQSLKRIIAFELAGVPNAA